MKKTILVVCIYIFTTFVFAQNNKQQDITWPVLSKSPWPMSYNNPQANGRTNVVGPKTPNVIWQINKESGIGSGPVISSSDVLYFGADYGSYFYAMTKDTLNKWTFKGNVVPYTLGGIIVDSDENIYFGSNDNYFNALDKNGNVKWQFKTQSSILVPFINIGLDTTLYFTSNDKNLYALHADGTMKWKVSMGSGFASSSPALSLDSKTIYICGRDSNLYALNMDGSMKWKYSFQAKSTTVPLVDAQGNIYTLVKGSSDFKMLSIKPDGLLRWSFSFEGDLKLYLDSSPCMDTDGHLFVTNLDKLISIDYNGQLRWAKQIIPAPKDIDCSLACDAEGKVYFGCALGTYYYCYNNNGEQLWSIALNGHYVDNAPAFGQDGTLYIGVHKGPRKISMIAIKDKSTSVDKIKEAPLSFELSQNFPNPFNPSTAIRFQLPENTFVTIKIYDLIGREVTTLIKEERQAGSHIIYWNGKDSFGNSVPSGMYLYKLTAGSFTETKKMNLLK